MNTGSTWNSEKKTSEESNIRNKWNEAKNKSDHRKNRVPIKKN